MAMLLSKQNCSTHQFYSLSLGGRYFNATVTASATIAKRWLDSTLYFSRKYVYRSCLVVGLGVHWTPGPDDPPAETLQLCIGSRCLIFQLAHANRVPSNLRTLLNNPNHTFVGFWNQSDRRKLKLSKFELEMHSDPLDLRLFFTNLAQASVEEIVMMCLGYEVSQRRENSCSMWYEFHLSDKQVTYAAVDVYCAFLIARNFKVRNFN
ncbi:Werner Syndrome-like exonuclease [Vigna radiata var. radiata]|uniref:Werner Syndrome-like exonuclease n=1 Tax=Vigna radiata var. radiata TaxID=3916 RepID=A0A1S3VG95_VIGRR|nr:Werner Syndrome-like exonuclease [Vigna radiata var. radiata]